MSALLYYFRGVRAHFVREGFIIGAIWFLVSCLLDFAILLPVLNISYDKWLVEIMPAIFVLPILSIGTGLIVQARQQI